jgi:DICT domain-containing protein/signal transduction histidine kinase
MSNSPSVLTELLQALPNLRAQTYFKSSLTALSHAMEDQVLAESTAGNPLIIAAFQRERFYRQEAHRYRRIADKSSQVYVLSAPETEFKHNSGIYETIAFTPEDSLAQEWHLIVIGDRYASCLICRERPTQDKWDSNRRFEGVWTFDRQVSRVAAQLLLQRILAYRPELQAKIEEATQTWLQPSCTVPPRGIDDNPDPFVQRLITYLQAGQYKLIKANRNLQDKEERERLLNSITGAVRRSLDPEEIMQVAVEKLGQGLGICRCVIYRCSADDTVATINHEFLGSGVGSIKGYPWPLKDNPLFQEVVALKEAIAIDNIDRDPRLGEPEPSTGEVKTLVKSCAILSWMLVPIFYRERLLGMMEFHHCGPAPTEWEDDALTLVEGVATQIGVALIQAESYANLQELNEQLAALDRTRSNLVAITGHELRTPLSTIQVCLESLATEPDMPQELRQVMLNTALEDAERMRKLVQDFLTLSQLESGRVEWNAEPISLEECVELSLSHIRAHNRGQEVPVIVNQVNGETPMVEADGEWLVELLTKLLDNAIKFTPTNGRISIAVDRPNPSQLEVTITDTGRGIEPNRLETVFDRFYQEEGALRRSRGGTGIGLAICRQIVSGWGGEIWAASDGKNHGTQFHFTVPIVMPENPNLGVEEVAPKKRKATSPRIASRSKKKQKFS